MRLRYPTSYCPPYAACLLLALAGGCAGRNFLTAASQSNAPAIPPPPVPQVTAPATGKTVTSVALKSLPPNSNPPLVAAEQPPRSTLASKTVPPSADRREDHSDQPVAWNAPEPEDELESPPVEEPPLKRQRIEFPPAKSKAAGELKVSGGDGRVSLTAREAPIDAVLAAIAAEHGLNIVSGDTVTKNISVTLTDVRLEDALDAILAVNGYAWARHKNIVTVSTIDAEQKTSPATQDRQVRVYALNYMTAADAEKVITGLLSPVGQVFAHQTSPTDQRKTHEQLVVEDLPPYLRRVEEYLKQTDTPPRQVMVEAHVLQVTLKGDLVHGVDFQNLMKLTSATFDMKTVGLANSAASPATLLTLDSSDLTGLVQTLKTTTDAKTLASPKLAVLNGQEAHLQIGSKLGFLLTTTTQTSTLQSVSFLDVGVILKVTPMITHDGRVLMNVKPQVSDGRINPGTNLPESNTTEVQTNVMLSDGEALIIGGLIKESDADVQAKIPVLGDIWLLGRLFQRRSLIRQRDEIIIVLVPRIVPNTPGGRPEDFNCIQRTQTPLLEGPLERVDRTAWEPELPDAYRHHGRYLRSRRYYGYAAPRADLYAPSAVPGETMEIVPTPSPEPLESSIPEAQTPEPLSLEPAALGSPPAPTIDDTSSRRQSPPKVQTMSYETPATDSPGRSAPSVRPVRFPPP